MSKDDSIGPKNNLYYRFRHVGTFGGGTEYMGMPCSLGPKSN
jgi:hypothetical protein